MSLFQSDQALASKPRTDGYLKQHSQGFSCRFFLLFAVSAMRHPLIAAIFLKSVLAAIYTDPSTLPNASYTYIIVGGTSKRQWIFWHCLTLV